MDWMCSAAFLTQLSSNANKPTSSGAKNSTSIPPRSMPMPRWIRSSRALLTTHAKLSKRIWRPFSLKFSLSLSPRSQLRRKPSPPLNQLPCLLSSPSQRAKNSMRSVRPATTGRGEEGRQQREVHGLYRRRSDERISTTDPDATPMRLKNGGLHLGYHTHYVVDGGKRRIILAALVTPSEVMDNQPMLDLLWHVRFRCRFTPRQVTGDTAYGTLENIKAIEDQGIRAYVPLPDWEHQRPYYGPSKFTYD